MVKRTFSDPPSILLSRELRIPQNGEISGVPNRRIFSTLSDLTASYNKLLGEVHYVTANARMSVQESKDESYGGSCNGFPE